MATIPVRLLARRGTAAQWAAANPVLAAGEIGVVTNQSTLFVGNGTSTYSALPKYPANITSGNFTLNGIWTFTVAPVLPNGAIDTDALADDSVTGDKVAAAAIDFDHLAPAILTDLLPPGTVCAMARSTAPAGWLPCNGALIGRVAYAELFSAIGTTFGAGDGSTTFAVPDVRGEFIRGADGGRGVDVGRAHGSAQGDAIRNITGFFSQRHLEFGDLNPLLSWSGAISATSFFMGNVGSIEDSSVNRSTQVVSFDASLVVPTASENRPRNIALLYCIKY
jgi:microcystin-dependent protein